MGIQKADSGSRVGSWAVRGEQGLKPTLFYFHKNPPPTPEYLLECAHNGLRGRPRDNGQCQDLPGDGIPAPHGATPLPEPLMAPPGPLALTWQSGPSPTRHHQPVHPYLQYLSILHSFIQQNASCFIFKNPSRVCIRLCYIVLLGIL